MVSDMINSMTGYGHAEKITKEFKISVEMKSVNHRYCDLTIKLPKKFNAYESRLRGLMKDYANRGKVDVYISFESYDGNEVNVVYHSNVAKGYMQAIREAEEEFGIEKGITGATLIRYPEVYSLEENAMDMETVYPVLEEVFCAAGEQFRKARQTEGEHLYADIVSKLNYVEELVAYVEARSPKVIEEYRNKIYDKVQELLGNTQISESALATEITLYADKVCVDEETVRLTAHIANMRETLKKKEPIGRKLDFLAQEMNREANTILSKANDKELSEYAIDLKTEIEKIREQIQNIE